MRWEAKVFERKSSGNHEDAFLCDRTLVIPHKSERAGRQAESREDAPCFFAWKIRLDRTCLCVHRLLPSSVALELGLFEHPQSSIRSFIHLKQCFKLFDSILFSGGSNLNLSQPRLARVYEYYRIYRLGTLDFAFLKWADAHRSGNPVGRSVKWAWV